MNKTISDHLIDKVMDIMHYYKLKHSRIKLTIWHNDKGFNVLLRGLGLLNHVNLEGVYQYLETELTDIGEIEGIDHVLLKRTLLVPNAVVPSIEVTYVFKKDKNV